MTEKKLCVNVNVPSTSLMSDTAVPAVLARIAREIDDVSIHEIAVISIPQLISARGRILRLSAVALAAFVVVLATIDPGVPRATAQESGRIQTAMSQIFGEEHHCESALEIHIRAMQMNAADRLSFLLNWVLPNSEQMPVRLQVAFTPTHPAPAAIPLLDNTDVQWSPGGRLVSPVLDLVDTATDANLLDTLHTQVEQIRPKNLLAAKNRMALLAIIRLRQSRVSAALDQIDEFLKLSSQDQSDDAIHRAAEVIVYEAGSQFPEVRETLIDSINRVSRDYKVRNVWTIWSQQFRTTAASSDLRSRSSNRVTLDGNINENGLTDELPSGSTPSGHWSAVSTVTAQSRGHGLPPAAWRLAKGRADNIISHGDDYLYFCMPLRGNFQIECDLNSFGWTDTELMVCGTWVSPVYTHLAVDVGDVRNNYRRLELASRMMKINDRLHYRTRVQDNLAATWVNGRLMHTQQLDEGHDPWVAIRNDFKSEGSAFDVRVTGHPEIPKSICITSSPILEGWLPYFGGSVGWSDSHWQALYRGDRGGNPDPTIKRGGGIFAARTAVSGDHEEALFYHRPMLEDGTIEYEFFYDQNALNAHPAIDRLCFLMSPTGVKIHWLTDGMSDRTGLSPDNEFSEPENQRGPRELPLKKNDWNRAALTLYGNHVDLILNGQLVYQRALEPTNQRRFGFFHYADRCELRVRNVIWTGNWPRQLPSVMEQDLAADEPEFLLQNFARPSEIFEHRFGSDGLDDNRISVIRGNLKDHLRITSEGLLALRPGSDGYQNTTIAPYLQLRGDFDITVAYENYESAPAPGGSSSLMLIAMLDNPASDEFFVTRRHLVDPSGNEQQVIQCVTVQKLPAGEKRDYFITKVVEERSGRLRLSRRGKQVWFLSAEGDSPNFRLWGSREIAADPVRMNGIRMVNQMHQLGHSSVVWKDVEVRADELTGVAVGGSDEHLQRLNQQRENLNVKAVFDFTQQPPEPAVLARWSDLRPWNEAHNGLRMLAEGSDQWEAAGIRTVLPIQGDFDITAAFEVVSMDVPRSNDQTAVYLQLETMDKNRTQLNSMYSLRPSGYRESVGQLRLSSDDGAVTYQQIGTLSADAVSALRIARRGTRWTTLVRLSGSDREHIVGEIELSELPAAQARILLHAGGPNRQAEILLKSIEIHADHYPHGEPQQMSTQKKKGLLESLLDLFR